MKQDQSFLGTIDELDARLTELCKTGERINHEFGKCLDRAGLLISVAKSLETDNLNAAKVGSASIRFDIGRVFDGIGYEVTNAQLCQQALEQCRAKMRDLWTLKRAMR
jgi:hypothetical protein